MSRKNEQINKIIRIYQQKTINNQQSILKIEKKIVIFIGFWILKQYFSYNLDKNYENQGKDFFLY